MGTSTQGDPVPAVPENEATGVIAGIFGDIRDTLNVEVVNLIWRHLATMPEALEWVWSALKPLYTGSGIDRAELIRQNLKLPQAPKFSQDTLAVAGLDDAALLPYVRSFTVTNTPTLLR
jgi:hypothetical protein